MTKVAPKYMLPKIPPYYRLDYSSHSSTYCGCQIPVVRRVDTPTTVVLVFEMERSFTRRFGPSVRASGGSYNHMHSNRERQVVIPLRNETLSLIDQILDAYRPHGISVYHDQAPKTTLAQLSTSDADNGIVAALQQHVKLLQDPDGPGYLRRKDALARVRKLKQDAEKDEQEAMERMRRLKNVKNRLDAFLGDAEYCYAWHTQLAMKLETAEKLADLLESSVKKD